jgi:hypothetical protein
MIRQIFILPIPCSATIRSFARPQFECLSSLSYPSSVSSSAPEGRSPDTRCRPTSTRPWDPQSREVVQLLVVDTPLVAFRHGLDPHLLLLTRPLPLPRHDHLVLHGVTLLPRMTTPLLPLGSVHRLLDRPTNTAVRSSGSIRTFVSGWEHADHAQADLLNLSRPERFADRAHDTDSRSATSLSNSSMDTREHAEREILRSSFS